MCIVLVIQLLHRVSIQAWPPCARKHASTALVRENARIGIRLDDQIRLSYLDFANHGLSSPPFVTELRVGLGLRQSINYIGIKGAAEIGRLKGKDGWLDQWEPQSRLTLRNLNSILCALFCYWALHKSGESSVTCPIGWNTSGNVRSVILTM